MEINGEKEYYGVDIMRYYEADVKITGDKNVQDTPVQFSPF